MLFKTTLSSCKYFLPIVKFNGVGENEPTLDLVKHLFQRMGYRIHFHEHMDWDILWSHTYPFYSLAKEMANLKTNQKVNHFPGSGFITQKANLATLPINHIPKSFSLPNNKENFLDFAKKNKDKTWLMKSSSHRGMKLFNGTENIEISGSFIQEFIKNPLLVSGKKFDIGIYVMLTSIDPLRVYIYSGDVLLRFCKQDYFPFNADSPESYIVGDDYLPIWEVQDLKFYYSELNYTAKESLNAYLHSEVRFDFILDEDMNVFLLEVNMSPNLSAAHFPDNRLLYEQIIYNSLSLVGLVRKFPDTFVYRLITRVWSRI
ncbi:hypothetical protein JTE90_010567 [Oedothorax gibbosus]|uniref:Uncharacterized protein n=1 Tax=Oedothorax gibbosus TaxID=931172 RepID=A0AAV6UGX4_9ARAC|nr:hypothetical protein JTE90_010567 [Oedothorax gibbosus]